MHIPATRPDSMRGCRILIIEDEPALARGLKDMFVAKGCEVISAIEGEAGLGLALSAKPDLILLDIMLPKINGYEICREIRAAALHMPIIILTPKIQADALQLSPNFA